MAAAASADSKSAYATAHAAYRSKRLERLQAENGWLTLCGLWFLDDGEANTIGSDEKCKIRLPAKCPKSVGHISYNKQSGKMRFVSSGAADAVVSVAGVDSKDPTATASALNDLKHDKIKDAASSCLQIGGPTGDVTLFVIERSGQVAIRGKDKLAVTRTGFKGIDTYPLGEKYCVDAKYEPFASGVKLVPHPNKLGLTEMEKCPGVLSFAVDGKSYQLEVIDEDGSDSEWFVIFRDATSGTETYGMRYLYTDRPKKAGETVKLDFNKAYNPPCAFTPYATCALATKQNRLPIRIEAGEKLYAVDH